MKLSTRTRYGTRVMVYLGMYFGKGPILLKTIAKEEGISEKYLSQIILILKGAGLVNSFRGANGGYELAKPSEEINLLEIVSLLEGNIELVKCKQGPNECERMGLCATSELWEDLNKLIASKLSSTSLSDLILKGLKKRSFALMYNI